MLGWALEKKGIFEAIGFVVRVEGIPRTPAEAPVGDDHVENV